MVLRPHLPDLLAALPLPTLAVNRAERIVAMNAEAQTLLGNTAIDRHYINVLRQPAVVDAVEQCQQDNKPREAQYLANDGGNDTTYRVHVRKVMGWIMSCSVSKTSPNWRMQVRCAAILWPTSATNYARR